MKNSILAIIFLGLAGYLGYELYQRGISSEVLNIIGPEETVVYKYPDEVKISSLDGRTLEVRLIARNADKVQFKRLSDGQSFVYPMAQLTNRSRELVLKYPEEGFQDMAQFLDSGQVTMDEVYVSQLKESIARIDEKLGQLKSDYSVSTSKSERLTIRREVEKIRVERKELEQKLADRE